MEQEIRNLEEVKRQKLEEKMRREGRIDARKILDHQIDQN